MSLEQLNNQAEDDISNGNFGSAINILTESLNNHGPVARTLINRATAFLRYNDHQSAIQDLNQAARNNPTEYEQNQIEELIGQLSRHVANNLDDSGSRELASSQNRDLTSTLLSGLLSASTGSSGSGNTFSKLSLLSSIFSSSGNSQGSNGQFSLSSVASLLAGQGQVNQGQGGFGSLISSLTGGSTSGQNYNNTQSSSQNTNQYYGNQNNDSYSNQNYNNTQSSSGGFSGLLSQVIGGVNSNQGNVNYNNSQGNHNQGNYNENNYNQGNYNQGNHSQTSFNNNQSGGGLGSLISDLVGSHQFQQNYNGNNNQGNFNQGNFNQGNFNQGYNGNNGQNYNNQNSGDHGHNGPKYENQQQGRHNNHSQSEFRENEPRYNNNQSNQSYSGNQVGNSGNNNAFGGLYQQNNERY